MATLFLHLLPALHYGAERWSGCFLFIPGFFRNLLFRLFRLRWFDHFLHFLGRFREFLDEGLRRNVVDGAGGAFHLIATLKKDCENLLALHASLLGNGVDANAHLDLTVVKQFASCNKSSGLFGGGYLAENSADLLLRETRITQVGSGHPLESLRAYQANSD